MRATLLNSSPFNLDGNLAFEPLDAVVDLVRRGQNDPDQVVGRANRFNSLISKELPVGKELIECLAKEVIETVLDAFCMGSATGLLLDRKQVPAQKAPR